MTDEPGVERDETSGRTEVEDSAVLEALASLVPGVQPDLVQAVGGRLEAVDVPSGHVLFTFGEASDAAYLVLRGRLRITIPDDDGERFIRDLGRGQIVGELGLINDAPRSATVSAVRDTVVARLSRQDFTELTSTHPTLTMAVANSIMERAARPAEAMTARAVSFTAVGDAGGLLDQVAARLGTAGSIERLSRERVASMLSSPGVAEDEDPSAAARVTELFARIETSGSTLVLEVDGSDAWTRRALRSSDLLVIAVPRDADEDEHRALAGVAESLVGVPHLSTWLVIVHPSGSERPRDTQVMRERYGADMVLHVREGVDADIDRLSRLIGGTGVGLVLGGGGARGFAHFGAYRALREAGVPVDSIGGASMGGILGAAMALDLDDEELLRGAERQFKKLIDYTIPIVGLAKGKSASRQLAERFGDMGIDDLWTPFFCVSTNLTKTASVVHDSGPLVRALRAGSSIPGVFPPTPIGDDLHVDAGVLDNLPVEAMRRRPGVGTVVAVDVAPPVGPSAKADYGLSVSGWKALRSRLGRKRSVYPGLSAVMMRSTILGSMRERDRLVAAGTADLYLDLALRGVSLLDFSKGRPIAQAGYEAAKPRIEEWAASTEYSST